MVGVPGRTSDHLTAHVSHECLYCSFAQRPLLQTQVPGRALFGGFNFSPCGPFNLDKGNGDVKEQGDWRVRLAASAQVCCETSGELSFCNLTHSDQEVQVRVGGSGEAGKEKQGTSLLSQCRPPTIGCGGWRQRRSCFCTLHLTSAQQN